MAEIFLDITRLLNRQRKGRLPTGVDRVGLFYLEHFKDRACGLVRFRGRHFKLSRTQSQRIFQQLLSFSGDTPHLYLKRLLSLLELPLDLKQSFVINTGHTGLDEENYTHELSRINARPIFLLHDLLPIKHPQFFRPGEDRKHDLRIRQAISAGAGIIANSQTTFDDLKEFADQRCLSLPPTIVAPLAPSPLSPSSIAPLNAPYFLMVGTIEPRKNHLLLLELWRELSKDLATATPKLVIIGQRGWECDAITALLDHDEELKPHIIELSQASDQELATYLKHARALLFPSFDEGYGLPVAEALSLGTPVITSDLKAVREFGGTAPQYLNSRDLNSWKACVLDYAQIHSELRTQQLKRLENFPLPGWGQHFLLVDEFLKHLADH